MKTHLDIPEVLRIYSERDNYKVETFPDRTNICIIYFSSHAIYFPNNDLTFDRVIVKSDRYEWKRNVLKSARKVIFVRDVQKQWYIEGINSQINSVEKLCELLKKESDGLDIICVGNSAGGYIATLVGCLISASHVFSFSGQFSLFPNIEESKRHLNPLLVKYENSDRHLKHYSLINIVEQSKTPIFYFYPANCSIDIEQFNLVKNLPNVYAFGFREGTHGQTCYPINYLDLFSMDINSLLKLHDAVSGDKIVAHSFSQKVSGFYRTYAFLTARKMKKLLQVLSTRRN